MENKVTKDNIKNEELLKEYVGKNYEKISTGRFNFPAFFLSSFYMFYRKMYLQGLLVFIVKLLLSLIFNVYVSLIIDIIIGFIFNKIYIINANNQINKITDNDKLSKIKYIGGTNIMGIFICLVIEIILTGLIFFGLSKLNIDIRSKFLFFDTNSRDDNSGSIEIESKYVPGTYTGIFFYSPNGVIDDEFSIEVPSIFNSNSSSSSFAYKYDANDQNYSGCAFWLGSVEDYTSRDDLINQMHEYYKELNATDIKNETINDINWSSFDYESDIEEARIYYYLTEKNNEVYLLEYDIGNNTDSNCETYLTQIINSIKSK